MLSLALISNLKQRERSQPQGISWLGDKMSRKGISIHDSRKQVEGGTWWEAGNGDEQLDMSDITGVTEVAFHLTKNHWIVLLNELHEMQNKREAGR